MAKKIVVLTGSPRKKGNSFVMTDAFIQTAEEMGHQVTRFDTAMMQVGGCRACDTCYSTGKACTFDDDFNKIAPAIEEADAVIFTMPVYWYTMPAQLKAVLDKMYSFMVAGRSIAGKECGLIACCEEDDMGTFQGVRFAYEKSTELMGWRSVGEVLVPGVNAAGDIEKTDGRDQAAALAKKF